MQYMYRESICEEFVYRVCPSVCPFFFYLVNKGIYIPGHLNLSHKEKKYFSRKLSH